MGSAGFLGVSWFYDGSARPAAPESRLTLRDAAQIIGVHRVTLAKWVHQERELAAAVHRVGKAIWFTPEAMDTARRISKQRMGGAPKAPEPTLDLSAAEAAAELGISRRYLRVFMMRHRIRKPTGPRPFTPDVMTTIRGAMAKPTTIPTLARREEDEPSAPAVEGPSRSHAEEPATEATMIRLAVALERFAEDCGALVRLVTEQNRALLERLTQPITLTLRPDEATDEAPGRHLWRRTRRTR